MIAYVSKENNLGPGDKIRYIWALKGPILSFSVSGMSVFLTSILCRDPDKRGN